MKTIPNRFQSAVGTLATTLIAPLAFAIPSEFRMNELSNVLEAREDTTWSVSADQGAALFQNQTTPGAITYTYLHPGEGEAGHRTITVDVEMLAGNSHSHAGLLYGFEDDPRSYFLFTVGGDQSVNLNYFDRKNGMQERMKMSLQTKAPGKTTLTIRENKNEIELLINGEMKSALGNSRMGRGAVGVVAVDQGKYRLSNFDIAINKNKIPGASPDRPAVPADETGPVEEQSTPPGASAPAGDEPSAESGTPTIFRRHKITDPGLHNMTAYSILVPETWKVEGGMTRPGVRHTWNPVLADLSIEAPDGRGIHIFPSFSFECTPQNLPLFAPTQKGYMYHPLPSSPGAWLLQLAKLNPEPEVSNLRLISEKPEPNITRALQQQCQQLYRQIAEKNQLGAQVGVGLAFDTQATVVTLQYTENGIELEESILIAWQYTLNTLRGQNTGGYWSIPLMVSSRGPVGTNYTEDQLLAAIFSSLQPDPAWSGKMNEFYAARAGIAISGANRDRKLWEEHNRKMQRLRSETSAIIAGGYAKRVAMNEAGHAHSVNAIHEVTPYRVPSGETVKLPSFYDRVYTDGNDRYLLTNDLNYNPQSDLGLSGNWQRISPQG